MMNCSGVTAATDVVFVATASASVGAIGQALQRQKAVSTELLPSHVKVVEERQSASGTATTKPFGNPAPRLKQFVLRRHSLFMTIQATAPALLPLGTQQVTIASVEEGLKSEYQGAPYLNVRLENEQGAIDQRLYLSEAAQAILAEFIRALGLDPAAEHDPQTFVGKSMIVDIEEEHYEAPDSGNERTIRRATHFRQTTP